MDTENSQSTTEEAGKQAAQYMVEISKSQGRHGLIERGCSFKKKLARNKPN